MAGLNEREMAAVRDLVDRLRRRLGDRLVEVHLYGSKARRTDTPGSDVDLLVVVAHHTVDVRDEVFTDVSDVMLEYDVVLDAHIADRRQLADLESLGAPYAAAIRSEGVVL